MTVIEYHALGGTIASTAQAGGAAKATLTGSDLLASLPPLPGITLEVVAHRPVNSNDLQLTDLVALAQQISASSAQAFIVSQGTDTMEETAFLLDLLVTHERPVIVTGAMRHAGAPGAEGPGNLYAALLLATAKDACDRGALVVMNDQILPARTVIKSHTTALHTFVCPGRGPLGEVVEHDAHWFGSAPRARALLPVLVADALSAVLPAAVQEITVGTVIAGLDDSLWWVDAARSLDALIIAGVGGGHLPSSRATRLATLLPATILINASRTGSGRVLQNSYGGYAGGDKDLTAAGLIPGGYLAVSKQRILVQLLLAAGQSREDIEAALAAM